MRPIRLEVKGFTAFRDPAVLDLADLDVFAIAGQTGSGKSSLLDAMTYALYGRVERVGDRVSQLVSQGQPRMAVTLEFEVGKDRFRVTRSTPSGKGATKILLERRGADGEWRQAGDGADRVRDAEVMITRAIGLTYDGFTRSVLLPQGTFAEFLVGEAKKRRDILTELLGLSLFRRMAERAGSIARECAVRAQERSAMVESEFSDATPEAVKEARATAKAARQRERALTKAAEQVARIVGRWEEAERTVDELTICADEATRAAGDAAETSDRFADLGAQLLEATTTVDAMAEAVAAAGLRHVEAQAAMAEAESRSSGSAAEVAKAQGRAHALSEALRSQGELAARRTAAEAAAAGLAALVQAAEEALEARRAALAASDTFLAEAAAALEVAQHADLVAAVSQGLRAGDPCPVCGLPLERAPKRGGAGVLTRARKAAEQARAAHERARQDSGEADRAADVARRDLAANEADKARLAAEVAELEGALTGHRAALVAVLGDPLPVDPAAALDARLVELQRLDREEREAGRGLVQAEQGALKAEAGRDRVASQIDRVRDRLSEDHGGLLDRAARALGVRGRPAELPIPPDTVDPGALRRFAEALGAALGRFAERLRGELEARASVETQLLAEATEKVGSLLDPADSLPALAAALDAECRSATAEAATSSQLAAALADKLQRRRELAEEGKRLEDRGRVFKVLAQELRADRVIAFLQAEALQLLAVGGSERLAELSDGRYRVTCRDDEFFVVDTWNGDEERSVRTLSGGETFLASLALALALADQVRALSITDRARLDSLFLDEGFGTLDPESLRTVTDAIEQLGGDGRLVGVITHVHELADQFPRIEVVKSPRGSRLEFVG